MSKTKRSSSPTVRKHFYVTPEEEAMIDRTWKSEEARSISRWCREIILDYCEAAFRGAASVEYRQQQDIPSPNTVGPPGLLEDLYLRLGVSDFESAMLTISSMQLEASHVEQFTDVMKVAAFMRLMGESSYESAIKSLYHLISAAEGARNDQPKRLSNCIH